MIAVDVLRRIAPHGRMTVMVPTVDTLGPLLPTYGLDVPLRLAHFLAQLAHECDGFRTTEEYASGRAYEGRRDLGNTQPGDGRRFKGRGLIQCTGRANYAAFTAWARARYPGCPDFEAEPTDLGEFPWAVLSALWFWDTRKLNDLADKDDLRAITRRINGGFNGLEDRAKKLTQAKDALRVGSGTTRPIGLLRKGSTGPAVVALQKALGITADGDFGPATETALRAWQAGEGLVPDGIAGPVTLKALGL